uniref:Uncharacterized protein n=1 Tax=Setaria digitata TaxID=48799 RepID=A0A915PTL6_9BILA
MRKKKKTVPQPQESIMFGTTIEAKTEQKKTLAKSLKQISKSFHGETKPSPSPSPSPPPPPPTTGTSGAPDKMLDINKTQEASISILRSEGTQEEMCSPQQIIHNQKKKVVTNLKDEAKISKQIPDTNSHGTSKQEDSSTKENPHVADGKSRGSSRYDLVEQHNG